jgi:hypothetical protein
MVCEQKLRGMTGDTFGAVSNFRNIILIMAVICSQLLSNTTQREEGAKQGARTYRACHCRKRIEQIKRLEAIL